MARTSVRRPIPAIIFILALSLLTALVWVRVLHRGDGEAKGSTTRPTSSPSATCHSGAAAALPRPGQVKVVVLNATQTAGLAGKIAGELKGRGFVTSPREPYIGNDPTPHNGTNEVRYGSKASTAARLVQIYLPGSRLVPTSTASTAITVSLGVDTKISTTAQVTQATKAAGTSCR